MGAKKKDRPKPWRMTRGTFMRKFEELLDERIEYFTNNLDTLYKTEDVRKAKRAKIKAIQYKMEDPKVKPMDMIKLKMEILSYDINFWTEGSLNPKSKEEIILRVLGSIYFKNDDLICLPYMLENVMVDEELLDDIIFILSGVFKFDYWDDEHVKVVVDHVLDNEDMLYSDNPEFNKIFKNSYEGYYYIQPHTDRISWKSLTWNPNFDMKFTDNKYVTRKLTKVINYDVDDRSKREIKDSVGLTLY